jgi:hypothetical protein
MKRKNTKSTRTLGRLNKHGAEDRKLNNQPGKVEPTMIQEALYSLAAMGLIYDTGRRDWCEQTQSYLIVWAAVPGKELP